MHMGCFLGVKNQPFFYDLLKGSACKCRVCACDCVAPKEEVWAGVLQPHQGMAPERESRAERENGLLVRCKQAVP